MTSNKSRRQDDDNTRPHKRTRLSQDCSPAHFDALGESYSVERNNDMFALHDAIQLPAKITGGHIRASVIHVTKYPNRNRLGVMLRLEPGGVDPGVPNLLECDVIHPKALECQVPACRDTVYVALTDGKVMFNEKSEQLAFKLKFETALIYVVPFEESDGDPRIIRLVNKGESAAGNFTIPSTKSRLPKVTMYLNNRRQHWRLFQKIS